MSKQIFVVVIAELFSTSLWFSANSAADSLSKIWSLTASDMGFLTNSVQFGFIVGTLFFSISGWADRYSSSKIFAICSILGAVFNACFALLSEGLTSASVFRFLVGLTLAGIYPLGMKLIVSWDPKTAGKSLGLLVGMLTLGTALPHGIRWVGADLEWRVIILSSSFLAIAAAAAIAILGDGPYLNKVTNKTKVPFLNIVQAFRVQEFRSSALGYFGHMWELYAFWTIVPLLLISIISTDPLLPTSSVSVWAFLIIGIGALGCILGGNASQKIGSARVAWAALITSGLTCFIYPFLDEAPTFVKIITLLIWGFSVVADSSQFSAMSAKACPPHLVGTALTIQNSIGFLITILSIWCVTFAFPYIGNKVAWILLPGPVLGLIFMRSLLRAR